MTIERTLDVADPSHEKQLSLLENPCRVIAVLILWLNKLKSGKKWLAPGHFAAPADPGSKQHSPSHPCRQDSPETLGFEGQVPPLVLWNPSSGETILSLGHLSFPVCLGEGKLSSGLSTFTI